MDFDFNTKFKKSKLENIFKKLGLSYKQKKDTYSIFYLYKGKKKLIRINIRKSLINVARYNHYINGITSYKQLESELKQYIYDIREDIINNH